MKLNARLTLVLLAVLALFGAGYLSLGVLDVGPTKQFTHLTLMLNSSGGLLPTSPVTMRGIKVGRVTGIQATPTGLAVSLDLEATHSVPANSPVSVQNLSVAGEQFINFTPNLIAPPYFTSGAQIPATQVAPTVTVSDLLARVHALFSALNPDDLRAVVSNVATAFAGNDDSLDSLATTAGLFANVVRDDKQLLAALFSNVSTLTNGLGDVHAAEVFSETGRLLPSAVPAFVRLIHSFEVFSRVGDGIFASDESVGQLIAKISEYLDDLAGPLGTFATVLQPITAPLHGVKVDSGHWLDFWESTFSGNGGMRVHLTVPESQQP